MALAPTPPRSFPYVQLAAFYLDGKPVERVMLHRTPSEADDEPPRAASS